MCSSGGLVIGMSNGLNKATSFLLLGCPECNAALHIATPKLTAGGQTDANLVDTIDRHFGNFLYGEQNKRSLTMCTAERAWPNSKHIAKHP